MVNFKPRAEQLRRERLVRELRERIESMARVAGDSALRNIQKAINATDEDEFYYYRVLPRRWMRVMRSRTPHWHLTPIISLGRGVH